MWGGNQWPLIYQRSRPKGGLCIIDPLYPNKKIWGLLSRLGLRHYFLRVFWITTNLKLYLKLSIHNGKSLAHETCLSVLRVGLMTLI